MKKALCLFLLFFVCAVAQAHPAVSIVQDTRGNIYFSDLKQVWKISPDGQKSVAVPNVHTHELCVDAEDNLYGEHLWYEGDATKKWGHRVWCLKRAGTLVDVIPAREGFLQNYSFVRDRAGNMYWADCEQPNSSRNTLIKKRTPDGRIVTHATGAFRDISWLTALADGTVFLIDSGNLYRLQPDAAVQLIARNVSERGSRKAAERHYQLGLWADVQGNVFVAVSAERLILKVHPHGATQVVTRSRWPWAPSGVMYDRDGKLWVLEAGTLPMSGFAARIRRINHDGTEQIF